MAWPGTVIPARNRGLSRLHLVDPDPLQLIPARNVGKKSQSVPFLEPPTVVPALSTSTLFDNASHRMKPPTRLPAQGLSRLLLSSSPRYTRPTALSSPNGTRRVAAAAAAIHTSSPDPAEVAPFHATGPPPEPPQPAAEHPYAKIERRRKQAELLRNAKEIRNAAGAGKGKTPLKKRFWQDVTVKEVEGAYLVFFPQDNERVLGERAHAPPRGYHKLETDRLLSCTSL